MRINADGEDALFFHPSSVVAGGINKDNVHDVIHAIQPFGVDVSSGVGFLASGS
jgi:phosphoribosylanthranilate isomerase